MPRDGCEPAPAVRPAADMGVTEAMTTEMAAAVMSTTVTAAMATTMATTVATAMTALSQCCTRQQASQSQRGNSNDWSQHLTLP